MITKTYKLPGGNQIGVYADILEAGHTLIAGAQGSGKSTVMAGLIHTAILHSPVTNQFILIDPKRVDLAKYSHLPHTLRYASKPDQIAEALRYAITLMEARYDDMARRHLEEHDGSRIFVIIDEVADLMTTGKRTFSPLIQRLAQLGRAAHVIVIMASQTCIRTVIDTSIKCNFASRIALRTASAQDSRNIIDQKGAEQLPSPKLAGRCMGIWKNGADVITADMPRYSEAERARLIDYWAQNKPKVSFSLFGRKTA